MGREHMQGLRNVWHEVERGQTRSVLWSSTQLLVCAAIALFAAGCGGSSGAASTQTSSSSTAVSASPGSSTSQPTAPVRQSSTATRSLGAKTPTDAKTFLAAAAAICKQRNTKLAATTLKTLNLNELGAITARRAVIEEKALAELAALTPPAKLASEWQKLVAYTRTLASETKQLGIYASSKDMKNLQAVSAASTSAFRQLAAVGKQIALKPCSRV